MSDFKLLFLLSLSRSDTPQLDQFLQLFPNVSIFHPIQWLIEKEPGSLYPKGQLLFPVLPLHLLKQFPPTRTQIFRDSPAEVHRKLKIGLKSLWLEVF